MTLAELQKHCINQYNKGIAPEKHRLVLTLIHENEQIKKSNEELQNILARIINSLLSEKEVFELIGRAYAKQLHETKMVKK